MQDFRSLQDFGSLENSELNLALVVVLVGVFILIGLAIVRAARGEPTTRWIVLLFLVLPLAVLLIPWAASTQRRFEQVALALVIALGLGLAGWTIARLRRDGRRPRGLPRHENGSGEPRP